MQRDEAVRVIWPDEATRDRVRALAESDPVMALAFNAGLDGALANTVPRITAGAYGTAPFKIMLLCDHIAAEGTKGSWDDAGGEDAAFVWREAYLAACRRAAHEVGQQFEAVGKAASALAQLAEGITATVEALTALGKLQAASAPTLKPGAAPHALALSCRPASLARPPLRRPLRPEDFGALTSAPPVSGR